MTYSESFTVWNIFTDEQETVDIEYTISKYQGEIFDIEIISLVTETGVDMVPEMSDTYMERVKTDAFEQAREYHCE